MNVFLFTKVTISGGRLFKIGEEFELCDTITRNEGGCGGCGTSGKAVKYYVIVDSNKKTFTIKENNGMVVSRPTGPRQVLTPYDRIWKGPVDKTPVNYDDIRNNPDIKKIIDSGNKIYMPSHLAMKENPTTNNPSNL